MSFEVALKAAIIDTTCLELFSDRVPECCEMLESKRVFTQNEKPQTWMVE